MSYENSIAFLGPAGTYCNEAALRFAAVSASTTPIWWSALLSTRFSIASTDGTVRFGVVGKENSLEGPVTATLDNFAFRTDSVILAEEVIDVRHCLAMHPEAARSDIRRIASHPQGIAQCRRFLAEHFKGVSTLSVASTAESARMAAGDPAHGGYLQPPCRSVARRARGRGVDTGQPREPDRFRIGGSPGRCRAFAGFALQDVAGALFARGQARCPTDDSFRIRLRGINLTMLQSRPTKKQLGDYMFFVELDGSMHDIDVQTALDCLRLKLREVKVFGSYPVE